MEIGEKIHSVLSKSRKFEDIQFIKKARIPLLEFTHVDTGKKCSITFCNGIGIATSKLTKYFVTLSPKTKYLTLYLKHLLKNYDFQGTGPSNKITTYMIFWLVVFLMQQKKILPSVYEVREMVPEKYDVLGWDCRVPAKVFNAWEKSKSSLYCLLLDFLKFYGDLDFLKYVLSPYTARAFTAIEVENSKLPKHEFSVYWKKFSDNIEKVTNVDDLDDFQTFPIHVMNLQDATNHSYNLTKQLDQLTVNQFKWFCYKLHGMLLKNHSSNTLEKILPTSIEKEYITSPNFVQVVSIHWEDFDDEPSVDPVIKQDVSCFSNNICKVMENMFDFKRNFLVYNDDIFRIITKRDENVFERRIVPYVVFYLEYISTSNTRWNANSPRLLSFSRNGLLHGSKVFIRCEINKKNETIDMFVQGEVQFTEFFKENLKKILYSMNNEE